MYTMSLLPYNLYCLNGSLIDKSWPPIMYEQNEMEIIRRTLLDEMNDLILNAKIKINFKYK